MTVTSKLSGLIDAAQNRATTLRADAARAITDATKLIAEAGKELPQAPKVNDLPADPPQVRLPDAPKLDGVNMAKFRTLPVKPGMLPVSITFPSAPTAPTVSFNVSAPNRPGNAPTFTKVPPTINQPPPAPPTPQPVSVSTPQQVRISLPQSPSITIKNFDGQMPDEPREMPEVGVEFNKAWRSASDTFVAAIEKDVDVYIKKISPDHDRHMRSLEDKLAEFVSGQTETGMSPAVENAIYARSQSKQDAEARRVAEEAISRAARMGFTMPSGSLMGAVQKARQSAADNNAAAAREIVVMQSELQQKNLQFALSTSLQLRQVIVNAWLSYHGNMIQINGQIAQYANDVVSALVKTHEIAVDMFKAKLDAYKADAAVYEAMTRASLAEVEVFKAKVEGELAKVKVNEGQVQVYKAQVDAHASAVQAYKANVEAIAVLANLEKAKLEAFEVEVRTFSAQVEAYRSEWQAYSAAWGGEEAKLDAELAKVRVYEGQASAFKSHIEAEGLKADSTARTNDTNLRAYEADIRAWAEEVRAYATEVTAKIDSQKSLVGAYQVGSQAALGQANAQSERYRALASVRQAKSELEGRHLLETAKIRLSAMDTSADTSISAAQVLRGLAESTMSGINTLVTMKEDFTATKP